MSVGCSDATDIYEMRLGLDEVRDETGEALWLSNWRRFKRPELAI